MKNEKKITNIFKDEIFGFAYFEDRRFEKAFCERLVFIYKSFLAERFPYLKLKIDLYKPQEQPQLLVPEMINSMIYFTELKELVSSSNYNSLLLELLIRAKTFDHVNMIFSYLSLNKNFDKETINEILDLCLKRRIIIGSFEAQRLILNFIWSNFNLIDSQLIEKLLSKFQRQTYLVSQEEKDKRQTLINKIRLELNKKPIVPNQRKQYQSFGDDFNLEIEASESELRKWEVFD